MLLNSLVHTVHFIIANRRTMRSTSSIDDFQRLMGLPEALIRLSDVVNCTMTSLVCITVVMTNQIRFVRRHDPYFMSISSSRIRRQANKVFCITVGKNFRSTANTNSREISEAKKLPSFGFSNLWSPSSFPLSLKGRQGGYFEQ